MSIHTRFGDTGQTSLIGGQRVDKDCVRICASGAIAQVGAAIEAAAAFLEPKHETIKADLDCMVNDLFACCHDISLPQENTAYQIEQQHIDVLESRIDSYQKLLPPADCFIKLGQCKASAMVNLAMTITRWAERQTVTLFKTETMNPCVLKYLNRLSDYLYVCARCINHLENKREKAYD